MPGVVEAVAEWGAHGRIPRLIAVRPRRWDDPDAAVELLRSAVPEADVIGSDELAAATSSLGPDRTVVVVCRWDDADDALAATADARGLDAVDLVVLDADPMDEASASVRAADWVATDAIADAHRRSAGRRGLFDAVLAGGEALAEIDGVITALLADDDARIVGEIRAVAPSCPWPALATGPAPIGVERLEAGWAALAAAGLTEGDGLVPLVADRIVERLGEVRRAVLAERIEAAIVERGVADAAAAEALAALGPLTGGGRDLLVSCLGRHGAHPDAERWAVTARSAGDRSAVTARVLADGRARRREYRELLALADDLIAEPATASLGAWFASVAAVRLGRWEQARPALAAAAAAGHADALAWGPLIESARGHRVDVGDGSGGPVDTALRRLGRLLLATVEGVDDAAGLGAAASTLAEQSSLGWPLDPIAAAAVIADVIGVASTGVATSPTPEGRAVGALLAMRAGRWAEAGAAVDAPGSEGRLGLVLAGVRVGLARRSGDLVALTAAWERERGVVATTDADLFVVDAVGELLAGAARLGRWADVRPLADSLGEMEQRLVDTSPWRIRIDWRRVLAAVAERDRNAAEVTSQRLRLAATGTQHEPLADAADAWCTVMSGVVAPNVEAAVEGLSVAGWPWEGSRLAGAAAAVTPDVAASRRLLEQARTLRPGLGSDGGESPLTAREQEIGALVVAGATYKEIGAQLYISPKTVEHHVARIRTKLGATTRAEMLAALRDLV